MLYAAPLKEALPKVNDSMSALPDVCSMVTHAATTFSNHSDLVIVIKLYSVLFVQWLTGTNSPEQNLLIFD